MNSLDIKDALSMIELDLKGLSSTLLTLSESENIYDLSTQLEVFSRMLSKTADQIDRVVDEI